MAEKQNDKIQQVRDLWSLAGWQLLIDHFLHKFQEEAVETHNAGLTQIVQGHGSTGEIAPDGRVLSSGYQCFETGSYTPEWHTL